MKKIFRNSINSNMLKTIALIAMVIDHIGFYFSESLNPNLVTIFRYIGRIAMPIFLYLLVQGFFYTKNFKKYLTRISVFAIITQILVTILMIINKRFYPEYISPRQVYSTGNILFSFALSLLLMKVLHEKVLIKKWNYVKNISLKVVLLSLICIISMILPLDYGIEALILSGLIYYIEKFRIELYIDRTNNKQKISNMVLSSVSDSKIELVYILLILFVLLLTCLYFNTCITILLSIIPIALYNGERGKCNKFVKNIYYIFFPLQHIILYMLGMLT